MQLLAMDIGGTYSRIAHCEIANRDTFQVLQQCELATANLRDFTNLLALIEQQPGFHAPARYDAVCIAIAGPVADKRAFPPNINWTLDLSAHPTLATTFLLNDFAAQGYAIAKVKEELVHVREGKPGSEAVAVVGAGTGLGHCLLIPAVTGANVIPSEAGQAGFSFSADEQDLQAYFHSHWQQPMITNDHVVSGPGLEVLHTYLTGEKTAAASIFEQQAKNKPTLTFFSRLYARACRHYVLATMATGGLVITGGLAARHPGLVKAAAFLEEFDNMDTHRHLLASIPISLNSRQDMGLTGAILYAGKELFS